MDNDTLLLCEILELDVKVMATLSPYRRAKVLEEAKRNVKKWPILNDVQRVEVNCALVELQYAKAREKSVTHLDRFSFSDQSDGGVFDESVIEADGKYGPIFAIKWDGTLDIHYRWIPTEEEPTLTPMPSIDHCFYQSQATSQQLLLHQRSGSKGYDWVKRIAPRIRVNRSPRGLEKHFTRANDMEDEVLHLENTKIMTGKVYHPEDIKCPDQRSRHYPPLGFHGAIYPYFLPDNRIMFFPAPTGHKYEFKQCKIIFDELDINAFIAKVMKEEEAVKEGKDGFMLAEWEMTLEFGEKGKPSCPFIECNAFDEWEKIARSQRERPKYRDFSPKTIGPSQGPNELFSDWI